MDLTKEKQLLSLKRCSSSCERFVIRGNVADDGRQSQRFSQQQETWLLAIKRGGGRKLYLGREIPPEDVLTQRAI